MCSPDLATLVLASAFALALVAGSLALIHEAAPTLLGTLRSAVVGLWRGVFRHCLREEGGPPVEDSNEPFPCWRWDGYRIPGPCDVCGRDHAPEASRS